MVLWGLLRRQACSASLKICAVACLVAPGHDIWERASGVAFPGRLSRSAERSQEHILMATGVRRVFLGMQAYAAGLYLEEGFARSLGKNQPPLIRGASYTIRIVPVRNTSLGHIRDALGRKLKELSVTEVSVEGRAAAQGEIHRFMTAFPNARLGMGEELLITRQGSNIHVKRPQQPSTMVEDVAWVGECLLRFYSETSITSIPDLPRDLYESVAHL